MGIFIKINHFSKNSIVHVFMSNLDNEGKYIDNNNRLTAHAQYSLNYTNYYPTVSFKISVLIGQSFSAISITDKKNSNYT